MNFHAFHALQWPVLNFVITQMTTQCFTMSNCRWNLKEKMKVNALVHTTMAMVWKVRKKLPLFLSFLY